MDLTITALVNEHCHTGENPFWIADGTVWWTDIPAGKIYRYDVRSGTHETVYDQRVQVGGFTRQADGNWLLFRESDFATLSPDGKVTVVKAYTDDGMSRFNDVQADLKGRVFAGTIGKTSESGGLYRVDCDGTVTKLFAGTGCSNGMGFTPDGQHMYWTDSTAKRIYRFRYQRVTGNLTDRELFYEATKDEGTPDGMAVDANGEVWSARWGGHAIVHHGTDGKVKDKIEMPVATVSSCFFGGPLLSTLFVTTADGKPGKDTADGTLYSIEMPVCGLPEPVSRILL